MDDKTKKYISLAVVLIAIVGGILFFESKKVPPVVIQEIVYDEPVITKVGIPVYTGTDLDDKQGTYKLGPELALISGYINTEENLTLESLRGNVVLIDFWTYSCINCIRTLPYLTAWDQKYKDEGLVIVGIHTPEFGFEKIRENVVSAMKNNNVQYAVVQDNDYGTWRSYENRYWPRKYLLDIDGYIRYDHIGEGGYGETEQVIQELLAERMERINMTPTISGGLVNPETLKDNQVGGKRTPEIYFGYNFRRGNFAQGNFPPEQIEDYAISTNLEAGQDLVYINGTFLNTGDYMELTGDIGVILLIYSGQSVNIVAGSDKPTEAIIRVDGKPISANMAGRDVEDSILKVQESRLYNIVQSDSYGGHLLEIIITDPGFQTYAFTFG